MPPIESWGGVPASVVTVGHHHVRGWYGPPFWPNFLTIFIGNLSWDAEREDLIHLFGQYGEVSKCSLPLDRETGRKRGFAFVDLSNEADEQSAIDDLQNVEWMGRAISVRKAEPRR